MALIQETLGDLVRPPLTEIRTVEQMMAERPAQDQTEAPSDIPPEIAEQIVHQFMDRQYRETLDQPVGMLGNKTPRQRQNQPPARRLPSGSNISKTSPQGTRIPPTQWPHTVSSRRGTNSASSSCVSNRYRISVSQ